MKKILTSHYLSIPMFILGVVFVIQSAYSSFYVSADSFEKLSASGAQTFLLILGLVCILLSATSLIIRYISRKG